MTNFELLGFTDMDTFYVTWCVAAGAVGAMLDYILKREDLVEFSPEPKKMTPQRWIPLMMARIFVGMLSGGFVWILLNGGMLQNKENFCRFVLMAFAAGFSSPAVLSKFRVQIDEKIATILSK